MGKATTIQLSPETKQKLESLQDGGKETFEETVLRLIDHYRKEGGTDMTEQQVREIVQEEITERVVPEAQQ